MQQRELATVTLNATDANGCVGTSTTSIIVDQKPTVNYTSNITQGCSVPLAVNFTNLQVEAAPSLTGILATVIHQLHKIQVTLILRQDLIRYFNR